MNRHRNFVVGLLFGLCLSAGAALANGVSVIPEHKPPPPCSPGTQRPFADENHGPIEQEGYAGRVQDAVAGALQDQGVPAGAQHVTVTDAAEDSGLSRFDVRLSSDQCALPHVRAISKQCIRRASQEGATHMLHGGIQRAGGQTRVTVRVVRVETGEIESTGRADANGTSPAAIQDAVANALGAMDYKIGCANGVVR